MTHDLHDHCNFFNLVVITKYAFISTLNYPDISPSKYNNCFILVLDDSINPTNEF